MATSNDWTDYGPSLFESLGLDYEMQLNMSGVMNILRASYLLLLQHSTTNISQSLSE